MARDFRIPRFYKTLLALAVVIGPMYWLMFTADGQRRTDMVLMFLMGRPAFDAALESFAPSLGEAKLLESFPKVDFACRAGGAPFGERTCSARIGSFNQYPAQAASLFFSNDALTAVKVDYQPAYHGGIRGWIERRIARLDPLATPPSPEIDQGVASWRAADGVLVMKDGELAPEDEPALFWLARPAR
jgi:hypothetical protein